MIEETLHRVLEPEVVAADCELWGIEYIDTARSVILKIYIEKSGGVTVDDCARVSEQVSTILDVEDPIGGHYTLEVSSPGIDRRLFTALHFESCKGEQVSVNLKISINGRRRFKGTLCGMENDYVVVRIDDEEYLLPIEQIEKARVIPDFG
ncbi:MAG: ribosome maturation factor RimP [Gammaproteobacteria bacterium]|uniref:Ribosome maturation factor RimP n=1 Tax=OM182 bacterium MED-G24 TaxID=1986255 RepID=A0A2A5WJJ1_9GAMM|nr:ribosome maturation factor RimP [Gammaproteobacteria bacterium]MAV28149.1 ribosome maturation factor RimP [Gammaproteobacteria bacterium]PDH36427.1 MAG: ribosome maturation factor RimP [OM182 bacterium MED-G24]RPG23094.1 MAG: ribosome maturation factor RimP [Gammaproteobacteria bacterium TMED50]